MFCPIYQVTDKLTKNWCCSTRDVVVHKSHCLVLTSILGVMVWYILGTVQKMNEKKKSKFKI